MDTNKMREPVAWFTDDHLTDKSATTHDSEVAKRWTAKGWPVHALYAQSYIDGLLTETERLREENHNLQLCSSSVNAAVALESEALRKDAERYRWLRTADWWRSPVCAISNPKEQAKLGSDCPSGERLDVQIDAAIAKEAPHG